jgi:hypothetical protein
MRFRSHSPTRSVVNALLDKFDAEQASDPKMEGPELARVSTPRPDIVAQNSGRMLRLSGGNGW